MERALKRHVERYVKHNPHSIYAIKIALSVIAFAYREDRRLEEWDVVSRSLTRYEKAELVLPLRSLIFSPEVHQLSVKLIQRFYNHMGSIYIVVEIMQGLNDVLSLKAQGKDPETREVFLMPSDYEIAREVLMIYDQFLSTYSIFDVRAKLGRPWIRDVLGWIASVQPGQVFILLASRGDQVETVGWVHVVRAMSEMERLAESFEKSQ